VHPDKQHPWRDYNLYRTVSNANTKAADAEFSTRHVHQGFNVFHHIPCIVSNLPKPDLLHTIQIGMLDHLEKWIFHFMKTHKQLDKYNAICLSVPAYISNNSSFRLKNLGIPVGSEGSDGTSYHLTENYMLPVAQATGRFAYSPPLLCTWYTHHQNDMCVTLFAGAAVML